MAPNDGIAVQPAGGEAAAVPVHPALSSRPARRESGPGGFPGGNPGAAFEDTRRCACRDREPGLPLLFAVYSFKVISTTVSLGSGRG